MALKDSSKAILTFVQDHAGEDFVAADIANSLGMEVKSVNGSLTGMQKKGWIRREASEVELEDGSHKAVKFIRLTAEGAGVDVNAN